MRELFFKGEKVVRLPHDYKQNMEKRTREIGTTQTHRDNANISFYFIRVFEDSSCSRGQGSRVGRDGGKTA